MILLDIAQCANIYGYSSYKKQQQLPRAGLLQATKGLLIRGASITVKLHTYIYMHILKGSIW